jgi:GxxExxY protein
MTENEISKQVVDAAFKIHTQLGPGLLESVYEAVLAYELRKRGLRVVRQKPIPVVYEEVRLEEGFRADLVVEDKVIIELKSVEAIARVHKKQVLTYLRLANLRLGLLINFGEELIKDGISRVVERTLSLPFFAPLRLCVRLTPSRSRLSPAARLFAPPGVPGRPRQPGPR